MSYSQDVYSKATEKLERRKERANIEAQARFDEISAKIPELEDIQNQLARVGLNISKVFLYSNDKQADVEKLMDESLRLQEKKKKLLAGAGVRYGRTGCGCAGGTVGCICRSHTAVSAFFCGRGDDSGCCS